MRRRGERHAEQLLSYLQPALVPRHPSEQVQRVKVITVAQQNLPASRLGRLATAGEVVCLGNKDHFIVTHVRRSWWAS
jgi:hypothetical protein